MATDNPETLTGTNGADEIFGLGGDDVIYGMGGESTDPDAGLIHTVSVGSGFAGAVYASSAPGDPDHLYVIKKDTGEIFSLDPLTHASTLFLDIPDDEFSKGGERGVLSLAFHPDYAKTGDPDAGRFFVYLTNPAGDIEIREYNSANGVNGTPVKTILTIPHLGESNHNGGTIVFGPNDHYLYVSTGDGGGANDEHHNAQNKNVLLGKILRIDVNGDDFPANDARNYAIPDDNPFVGTSGGDEIWALGLRNPFRISFDTNGDLYIGDVGQSAREEIDFQRAGAHGGKNYGWPLAEGTLGDPPPGAVPPIFEYSHSLGNVVTGGLVYHDPGEPSLEGAYLFIDFGSDRFWTLKVADGHATGVTDRTAQLTGDAIDQIDSFGTDGHGNVYMVSLKGDIFRLDPDPFAGDIGDRLYGGEGLDSLYGGPGGDELHGGADADFLNGGFGRDFLLGGRGGDTLMGDSDGDRLNGGRGPDSLTGGDGPDRFIFDAALGGQNLDDLVDYTPGTDIICLDNAVFHGLADGPLPASAFFEGAAAHDASDRIIYNAATDALFFDANGNQPGGRVQFATVDAALTNADFFVI